MNGTALKPKDMKTAKCCYNCGHSVFCLPGYNGYAGKCRLNVAWFDMDSEQGETVPPDGICKEYCQTDNSYEE